MHNLLQNRIVANSACRLLVIAPEAGVWSQAGEPILSCDIQMNYGLCLNLCFCFCLLQSRNTRTTLRVQAPSSFGQATLTRRHISIGPYSIFDLAICHWLHQPFYDVVTHFAPHTIHTSICLQTHSSYIMWVWRVSELIVNVCFTAIAFLIYV